MSTQFSKYRFLGGLAVAFMLPLSFYLIAKGMSKDKLHMPRYYNIDSTGTKGIETVYHRAAEVQLTNQLGTAVALNKDLAGKILIINVFSAHCNSNCPKVMANMKILQKAFSKNPRMESSLDTAVQLITITLNPAQDSFSVLRAYADGHGVNHDHWWFLTGDETKIFHYLRTQLFLPVTQSVDTNENLIHMQTIVVLDKNRYVRGYYNGLDLADIKHCADDVVLLSIENEHKRR